MAGTVNASSMSVAGLASGIDTKAIIDSLIYADRATARLAESKRTSDQSRLDSIKALNTKLLSLRDSLDDLRLGLAFGGKSATSSDTTKLTASATTSAVNGSMVINVKSLARAQQVAGVGEVSNTLAIGSGSIVLRLASAAPGDPDITISPTDTSLNGIAEAINDANVGVVASVVNDGSSAPYRLVITAAKTGTANQLVTLQGTDALAGILPGLNAMETISAAQDATVRLGDKDAGMLLTSASNQLDGLIPGLTVNLLNTGDDITVSVANDTASARDTLQSMIDAYNGARAFYAANSTYDATNKSAGSLFGDYDIRNQLNAVEAALLKPDTSRPSGFQTLSDLGITIATDGTMKLNQSTFDAKMAQNPDAVTAMVKSATQTASTALEQLTRENTGAMALKQSFLKDEIQDLTDRVTAIDARLEQRKAYYQAKFLAMEKITAQMQSQGTSITNFVNGLSKSNS